ncbi:MAG: AAA family ATPase [Pirellulaceae bacterium]
MRLTLSVYVSVQRDEGRSIYVCQPLRSSGIVTKDPLLSTALNKLGNKVRKQINGWIEEGQPARFNAWLYDPETQSKTLKLTLTLRDRTLRWKLLLVTMPAFDRLVAFSPAVPEVAFEVASMAELEQRAVDVYTQWAQATLTRSADQSMEWSEGGDMWVEPLEITVEQTVRTKKKQRDIFAALFGGSNPSGNEELHKVGVCLDDNADTMEQALGRGALVDEVDRVLQRDDRQGVLLVGQPAAGKTAIIYECVRRRVQRMRERRGHRPQVWWLSPQRLISGMSYLGQWEQRWLAILREATKRDHILYFDDLVGLFSAGLTRDSSLSAADVLRTFLSDQRVRIVGETTHEQLAILRRRDRALADRFHLVYVPSLSADDSLPIVLEAAQRIESTTERFFNPETTPLVTRYQEIFAPDQAFPGKAIEMLKTLAKHSSGAVSRSDVYRLAGTQSGASLELLLNRLGNQQTIRMALAQQLVGQPGAIEALSRIVVRYAQHLQPTDRPLGVLLLLGPTGVGKTEAAKALTRMLYNDESHLVRIDMNELTTPMAAEELVGTFDRPEGRLTSAVRRQPNCVILLDEIEKAHPDVFDYLLQVLGEGRLTDARGRVADFRSAIIIMTSNLGASEQSTSLGFDITAERRSQIYAKAAQQFFRPEFFNRIDEVVAFRRLDATDLEQIVKIQLDQVLAREGIKRRGAFVRVDSSAIKRVVDSGFDTQLGARAVRRMLEREIIGPLANVLSSLPVGSPVLIHVRQALPNNSQTASAVLVEPAKPRAEAFPRLDCNILPLEMAPLHSRPPLDDLPSILQATDALYQRLDTRLSEIADQLREIDVALGEKLHNASYYALREQLYRCSQLRKSAEFRLNQRSTPALNLAPPSSAKPKSRLTERGPSKSALRDWAAHEDLRQELSGTASDPGLHSPEDLAKLLVRDFVVATAMIENALTPRSWLVGVECLTGRDQWQNDNTPADFSETRPYLEDPTNFSHRLFACLRDHWQYEFTVNGLVGGFHCVSGVSLIGILGPLLGTYQQKGQISTYDHPRLGLVDPSTPAANRLLVLRAIPTELNITHAAMNERILENRIVADNGELRLPREQTQSFQVIQGAIDQRVVHFPSGSRLETLDDWFDLDKIVQRTVTWWLDCLPLPQELSKLP